MTPSISVALTLRGKDIDHDRITASVGIKPSQTWQLGDLLPNTSIKRKQDGWRLDTGKKESHHLDEQIRFILDQIRPHSAGFLAVCEEFNLDVVVECVVNVIDEVPSMAFEHDLIKLLAELKIEMDIDLYLSPSE